MTEAPRFSVAITRAEVQSGPHMQLKLLAEGSGYQLAQMGSLMLTTHTRAASIQMVDQLHSTLAKHRLIYPRFSLIALVGGKAIGQPEAGLRDRVISQEKEFEQSLIGAAIAIEVKGLPAVITRTFLAAYTLLSSHVFPLQSFGDLASSVQWLKDLPDQDPAVRADADIVSEARQLLDRGLNPDRL